MRYTTTLSAADFAVSELLFYTDGAWSAQDLSVFLAAMQGMYDVCLVILPLFERPSALVGGIHDFRRALSRTRPNVRSWGLMTPSGPHKESSGPREISDVLRARERAVFRWKASSLIPNGPLDVFLHMESPGWMSLRGLGEPVRQLRHLIKGFEYRNSQEKHLGEIKIQMAQMKLREMNRVVVAPEAGRPTDPTALLASGLDEIDRLEARGLLRGVSESMEEADRRDRGV